MMVKLGIITSSFFLIPNALIAISKAAVPFDTEIEKFLFTSFEKLIFKFLLLLVLQKISSLFLKPLWTLSESVLVIKGLLTGINFLLS